MPNHHQHNWDDDRFILAVLVAMAMAAAFIVLIHVGAA